MEAFGIAFTAHDEGFRAHTARDDAELAFTRSHRPLPRHEHVCAVMVLATHVVVVTLDRRSVERDRPAQRTRERPAARRQHEAAICLREVLRPLHGFHVVGKVFSAFLEVRKVLIGELDVTLSHVGLGRPDEVGADAAAHSAPAAVKHEPHVLFGIQAKLDEVVASSECPEVRGGINSGKL